MKKQIPFYQFPVELINMELTPTAKITYMILYNLNFTKSQIKQETLAKKLDITERHMIRIINELKAAGLITKVERISNGINKYTISIPFTEIETEKQPKNKKKKRDEESFAAYDINEIEKYAINYEVFKDENQD